MLTRIYGTAFESKEKLVNYLEFLKQAELRNHIKLGKELDLFSIQKEGPGFPFFHPKGMIVWNELLKYWREEHTKEDYLEVSTPMMLNKELWEKLDYLSNKHNIKWVWVRGHTGHAGNERADQLANEAIDKIL